MKMKKFFLISLFAINSLMFFFQSMSKAVYTPLVTPFRETFQISYSQAGLLITLVFLGYALARFPSGILTDIFGCERVIMVGCLLTGFSLVMVGFAPGYYVLAVFSFIMGLATGIYITAGYTYAVALGEDERETTFTALLEWFGGISGLLAPLVVVLFLEDWQLGWRAIFSFLGLGVIVGTVVFYLLVKKRKTVEHNDHNTDVNKSSFSVASFKKEVGKSFLVFKDINIRRFIIWATLVGGFGHFANMGFRSFIPAYLEEIRHYDYSAANQLFMIISISGLVSKIILAWIADKIGNRRVLLSILLLNFILFFIFTFNLNHILFIIILVLFGVTFINHNTMINSYVLKLMPQGQKATGFGLFSTLYTVIYSMGPVITGFFNDRLGMVFGMRTSVVGIVIAGVLIIKFEDIMGEEFLRDNCAAN